MIVLKHNIAKDSILRMSQAIVASHWFCLILHIHEMVLEDGPTTSPIRTRARSFQGPNLLYLTLYIQGDHSYMLYPPFF